MATGLIWKGTWVGPPSSFTYYINECVTYGNISYVCVAPAGFVPAGSNPPNVDTTNWNIVVTGGQNGAAGQLVRPVLAVDLLLESTDLPEHR